MSRRRWSEFRRYWVGEALSNLGTRTGQTFAAVAATRLHRFVASRAIVLRYLCLAALAAAALALHLTPLGLGAVLGACALDATA